MTFVQVNPNPANKSTGDCVIRALSILLDKTWDEIYLMLSVYGFALKDWGANNAVWERYLYDEGYQKGLIPNTCPDCMTIEEFFESRNSGRYLVATGQHVVAIIDGVLYDSWNSLSEIPIYYYYKKN